MNTKLIFTVTPEEMVQLKSLIQSNETLSKRVNRAEFEFLVREDVKQKAEVRKAAQNAAQCAVPVTEIKTA